MCSKFSRIETQSVIINHKSFDSRDLNVKTDLRMSWIVRCLIMPYILSTVICFYITSISLYNLAFDLKQVIHQRSNNCDSTYFCYNVMLAAMLEIKRCCMYF